MCGIAGLIYRDGARNIGGEMTAMLQALKHRGPDSTGFAIYGEPGPNEYIMRFKVAEQEDLSGGTKIHRAIAERKAAVDELLKELGVKVLDLDEPTEYANRYRISYDGDLKTLADQIEEIEGTEILSIGNALELIKDLGDASRRFRRLRPRRVPGNPWYRPYQDGHRIGRRYPFRPPLLGLSV